MARPHIPTPLEGLGNRPFSFYPPLRNTEHNEWILQGTDWDEVQVMNRKSRLEVSIPSRFVGGVSSPDDPVVIVGLRTELELREGAIVPCIQRVIEMPRAVNGAQRWQALAREDSDDEPAPRRLAPVVGIRIEDTSAPPVPRKFMAAAAAGLLACVVSMALFRDALTARDRYFPGAALKISLPLTFADDYDSVVNQLGTPARQRTVRMDDGHEFLLLRYPGRGFSAVLENAHYLGALGRGGHVLHSVVLPDGRDSAVMLRDLKF